MALQIKEIIDAIEVFAPLAWQEEWDNSGIQVGNTAQPLTGIVVCVDITEEAIDTALKEGCNLILSHHPLLFKPLSSIQGRDYIERCVIKACKHDLVLYSCHTNLDSAPQGVSHRLAQKLGLQNIEVLEPKPGVFSVDGQQVGLGVIGLLPEAMAATDFLKKIAADFSLKSLPYSQGATATVQKIAICGGSGGSVKQLALAAKADVLLTGEVKYNDFHDVSGSLLLATVGHFESEVCTNEIFYEIIQKKFTTFAPRVVYVNSNPIKYL